MKLKTIVAKYGWFVLLIAVAVYFLFFRFSRGTINPSWKKFAVSDTAAITSIVLSNDSATVTLNRTEKGWLVNSNYKARTDAIKAFLTVAARLNAGAPLPKSVSDSLSELIERKGINVRYLSGNRTLNEYNVISTKTLDLKAIGKLNDANVAFSLQLLGFNDDISSLFVLDPDYWKSNQLFIADLNQIEKVEVEIPDSPEKSFSVGLDKKGMHLRATYFDKEISDFDTSSVVGFIVGLTNLSYEKIVSKASIEERAAIVLSQPAQIYTVTLTNKNKLILKTYPIPIDEYRDEFGRTVKFDLNRLYISFNDDAIVAIATYMVFDPVLKDLTSFRKEKRP